MLVLHAQFTDKGNGCLATHEQLAQNVACSIFREVQFLVMHRLSH
jgi:hypothetical protein